MLQSWWSRACALALLVVLLRVALDPFQGRAWQPAVADIESVLRSLLVAAAMVWAARATAPRDRTAWRLLAVSVGCWLVADILWLILARLDHQPWGSVVDVFYLAFYPLVFAGVVSLLPRRDPRGGSVIVLVDMAAIAMAASAVMWVWVVRPLWYHDPDATLDARLVVVSYPVGDLLLFWVAVTVLLRHRVRSLTSVPALLAAGALTLVTTDLAYAVEVMHDTYRNGNHLGIGWALALVLIGLSGVRRALGGPDVVEDAIPSRMTSAIVAAVSVLALCILLALARFDSVLAAAACLGAVILVVRQVLASAANIRLKRALEDANAALEERVRLRTGELAAAERRLAEAERLEAVGRVAGAVAHDFNNILVAVSGHAELALQKNVEPYVRAHLDQILLASRRASELARRLMASARPEDNACTGIDLAGLVREVADQIGAMLPPAVELAVRTPGTPAMVLGDAGQLHQVLMNLCVNARDAMPHGGRLLIQVEAERDRITVVVADTGHGMDETVRSRLFEPYFTTKPHGQGNGLGLVTVHGIVRRHRGSIDVDSAPGAGARFTVRLPVMAAAGG